MFIFHIHVIAYLEFDFREMNSVIFLKKYKLAWVSALL
ncbi:hypothetical protein ABID22_001562 [Pontibacter aydingkolensis]